MYSPETGSGEAPAPCVGRLEIATAKKPVGFLCGTLPVPTDAPPLSQSAGFPSPAPIEAPRYQMLPTETDLNTLPLLSGFRDSVFPATCYEDGEYLHLENTSVAQNLSKKCETLAMCGLVDYEDEIDVVAPTDILKQIFKIPYSKSQLSIAVQRIGNTLILNTGPGFEEGEKIYRRQGNQSKGSDPSILLNFAMHSVRAEACDCPPTYIPSTEMQSSSKILRGQFGRHDDYASSTGAHVSNPQYIDETALRKYPQGNCDRFFWGTKQNNQKHKKPDSNRSSQIGEKPKCPVREPEKYRRSGDNSFLRVLFWQFHNFRMFLGSDLLLFSNEKYVAVSLHLWDVSRQVTPITWLEAWLDNVMANVPELAICYHRNGVVQGYELLKTDDIFLLKGVADDGAPAFNPQIVEKHGLSVLKFLQNKCKQDPGSYWLYRRAGEDVIQLFDLSILPKNHVVDDRDKSCSSFLSLLHKGRRESLFTLGTLLCRVAHRLSLSKASHNRARCAKFLKKCLNFLSMQDQLVIQAFAHEQFARLILKCYEEFDLTTEPFLLESEVTVIDLEDESAEFSEGMFGNVVQDKVLSQTTEAIIAGVDTLMLQCSESESLVTSEFAEDVSLHPKFSATGLEDEKDIIHYPPCGTHEDVIICQMSESVPQVVRTIAEPISSKLAAIHHVSQAIKSLRWKRQLQNTEGNVKLHETSSVDFSLCACGDVDCIEIYGIPEWLAKSKIDKRMWNLVLLLGESFLALGEAYKEDGQLHQALKVCELASLFYGSMPQQFEDAQFISSIVSDLSHDLNTVLKNEKETSVINRTKFGPAFSGQCSPLQLSSNYLFWAKAWELVGDVYVEYYRRRTTETLLQESKRSGSELRMSNEVMREVQRLKKKLGQHQKNCSTCSLVNCSCQSDRASSGGSASSSNRDATQYGRKLSKKSRAKSSLHSDFGISKDDSNSCKVQMNTKLEQSSTGCSMHTPMVGMYRSRQSSPFYSIESEDNGPKRTLDSEEVVSSVPASKDTCKLKQGGIFKYIDGPKAGEVENNLLAAIDCYHSAVKALVDYPKSSCVIHSIVKKKGWVFNELGRYRIERGNLASAEVVFREAIKAFKEVSDPTNIILINCNLGHGRRAVAEELLSRTDELRKYDVLQNVYKKTLKTAKTEYMESLKYYGAAKTELMSAGGVVDKSLHNEVYTQYGHTYLRLGMLLAKESSSKEDDESGLVDEFSIDGKLQGQLRPEMSTGDALREALSTYEFLGGLRKQEAAFTYFQLACYHRDRCMEFLYLNKKQINLAKHDNYRQRAKWYASLAEKIWKKSAEFYGPRSHPIMYLNILLELSDISLKLSSAFDSLNMLEKALDHLLEGRHVDESEVNDEIISRFWNQLQSLLKSMLAAALSSGSSTKSGVLGHEVVSNKAGDALKLREMYRVSLKSTAGLGKLLALYNLWN